MKKFALLLLLCIFAAPSFAQDGARDAVAVLNRCGKPLKGDDTVFTNTDSTRTLLYERGTLNFTRVGDNGWKFVSADHKQRKNLTAEQMSAFMPCLTQALADSASTGPLPVVTPVERIEVSARHSYRAIVLYSLLGLVLLAVVFFLLSRRKSSEDYDE